MPANASSITIRYWWYGVTNHTTHKCRDTFSVEVLDSSGNAIGKVQSACNTDATQSWQQATFDATSMLSNHAGQTVTLVFSSQTTSSWATSAFFVDDVDVSAL